MWSECPLVKLVACRVHAYNEPRHKLFSICKNKGADQLLVTAQLGSAFVFATIPLLPKAEIPSLWQYSVAVQPGLCRTDLVGNIEDRFSRDAAQMEVSLLLVGNGS